MDILYITHLLNGLIMAGLPIALGFYLTRRFKLGWRIWWIGAGTFVLSQVGHIPFNALFTLLFQRGVLPAPAPESSLIFNAVFLGLSSGLWEELSRAAAYRWWARDARSWRKGVLMGAGHGGIEALILGLLVLTSYVAMVALRSIDISTIIPPEQLEVTRQGIQAYWSVPWPMTLLGALERALTIPFHISLSVLVLQAFTRRQPWWVVIAILWHALANAAVVYLIGIWAGQPWASLAVEGVLAVNALISLAVIFALRRPEPVEPAPVEVDAPPARTLEPGSVKPEVTGEHLDESRFSE